MRVKHIAIPLTEEVKANLEILLNINCMEHSYPNYKKAAMALLTNVVKPKQ